MRAIIMARDLKRLIAATSGFVTGPNKNPVFNYIRLEFCKENASVTAIGVDGYRLSVEHSVCGDIDEDFVAYVRPFLPRAKQEDAAVIEVTDGYCYIKIGDLSAGFKQPFGTYLDYAKILTEATSSDPTLKIGFNGNYLLKALQAASASCGGSFAKPVVLEFRGPLSPVILRTNKEDVKMVLPIRIRE